MAAWQAQQLISEEAKLQKLQSHIDAFLKSGVRIQQVPQGAERRERWATGDTDAVH